MKCCQCSKRIDLSRAHRPSDGSDWTSTKIGSHGRDFCSMRCADAWKNDPANAVAVEESHRTALCSAYLDCVIDALMLDVRPSVRPRFASCDATCPLRRLSQSIGINHA